MGKKWYTIAELSYYLNLSTDDIDRLLLINELRPSICLPLTSLVLFDKTGTTISGKTEKHGMFGLIGYEKIKWNCSWQAEATFCDPCKDKIRLLQHDEVYGFNTGHILNKDEILITSESIKEYEAQYKTTTSRGNAAESGEVQAMPYLDPNHKHYSKELAVAVNTWCTLYDKDGAYKANRSHKDQIKATLAGNGLSDAAIDRIATLVNPNKAGGAPSTDY